MPLEGSLLAPAQLVMVLASSVLFAGTGAVVGAGAPNVARFVVAALALASLAALVGESLDQVGRRLRPGATGLLQASLGNLPELLVSIFALRAGLARLVQAALIGSVLGNLLLVLGVAFLSGALRHGTQSFEPEAPRMTVALLTLAVGSLAVPTLAERLDTPAAHHAIGLSEATAIVLLLVYVVSIPFWLRGGVASSAIASTASVRPHTTSSPSTTSANPSQPGAPSTGTKPASAAATQHHAQTNSAEPPASLTGPGLPTTLAGSWPLGLALAALVLATAASGAVSDWFVGALEPATRSLGISEAFTGLVIVAIASNAVENAAGIRFAWKARADYAISTILNSPLQIALLLTPLLVLLSPALGPQHLVLVFPPLLVAALAISTVAVGIVIYDGEYSWLEGASLVALYAIVASAFWWG